MKIAFYCQHILGIGHLKRSLQLCSALADRGHTILLFLGGTETVIDDSRIEVWPLPCLRMDENFGGIFPCDQSADLEEVKQQRRRILLQKVDDFQPELFISELYPMGRKAFRFELDPLLDKLQDSCLCIASVRDILVEKTEGREKFEKRAVKILNSRYHGLLIHSDPEVIQLDESFTLMDEITIPIHYTGFIAPDQMNATASRTGQESELPLIVASIGGSQVGEHLLEQVTKVAAQFHDRFQFKIFCGKDSSKEFMGSLQKSSPKNAEILPFSSDFDKYLASASLSLSMAGYNTCMNLLQSGTPALCLPFAQNREQNLRIHRLQGRSNIQLLREEDLHTPKLTQRIEEALSLDQLTNTINLEGAHNSAQIIEEIRGKG